MKKILVLSIVVLVCFLCMLAYTQKEGEKTAKVDPKADLQKSVFSLISGAFRNAPCKSLGDI